MQRELKELDPSQETLDEMTITLPGCKHTFSVETLDGHCRMSEHYQVDSGGKYIGIVPSHSSAELRQPPTCPTCRQAIRSPRFGRVYKRADLDILERNIAFSMSRNLSAAREIFDKASTPDMRNVLVSGLKVLEDEIAKDDDREGVDSEERVAEEKAKVLDSSQRAPIIWADIDPRNAMHSINPIAVGKWSHATRRLREAYHKATIIANTNSAHSIAWDASFASLYRHEKESYVENPESAPRRPEEHAMRVARMKVGQHKPLADQRYHVEAIWLMLDIRFRMIELANSWLSTTRDPLNAFTVTPAFKHRWLQYVSFLVSSCEKDSKLAFDIAGDSGSQKQALRSKTLMLLCRLEHFKLEMQVKRERGLTPKDRDEMLGEVRKEMQTLAEVITREGPERRERAKIDAEDYLKYFTLPTGAITRGWKDVEGALIRDERIPPSDAELVKILAALTQKEPGLREFLGHY